MAKTREPRPRGLLAELERIVLSVALAASIATLLLVSRSALVPTQRPLTFGMAFGMAFLGLYLALGLIPAAIAVSFLYRRGWRHTAQVLVTLAIAGFGAAVALWNAQGVRRAFAIDGPTRFRYAVPAALALAAVGLLAAVVEPFLGRRGRLVLRATALLAVAATVFALSPLPPTPATLTGVLPTSAQSNAAHRFLLIGIDGADWRYIDPLIARGELPHLAALKQRGAFGPLRTAQPTLSPVVWTSIATGVPPGRHGINGFFTTRLEGVSGPLPRLKPPHRLGFGLLSAWLRSRHLISEGSAGSDTRGVPAYWNMAATRGLPVVVVNWWVTWPAEPVAGVIVSDQFYFDRLVQKGKPPLTPGTVFPEALFDEIDRQVVLPAGLPIETARAYFDVTPAEFERMRHRDETLRPPLLREFNYYVAAFETNRRIARHLLERERDGSRPDALVLFRVTDKMSHAALEYSDLVSDHLGHSQTELARFGGVIAATYRAVDSAVAELMTAFGDGNVIIVSDHGFQLERPTQPRYAHDDAPDGIFLAAGPAFQPGAVEGLCVYDVLPLLLYLKDLPTAEDQAGRLPRAALSPILIATQPERRIQSYGTQEALQLARSAAAVEEERREQLRALGYIRY